LRENQVNGRKQWFNQVDAPELNVKFNGKLVKKQEGNYSFNDKKWLSFSKGVKLTYAYHLMFSRDEIDLNQLSFGISGGLIQSQLDETSFTVGDFDPIIDGQLCKGLLF
jgi:hypothetical protein